MIDRRRAVGLRSERLSFQPLTSQAPPHDREATENPNTRPPFLYFLCFLYLL
jgi:hypothetical protein